VPVARSSDAGVVVEVSVVSMVWSFSVVGGGCEHLLDVAME
jgi:hypothetical protein